ncbi:hypothetical protein AGMMS50293_17940 [Spirochaetia bacterium]|nr:hypothetical protein AGMMS50293_17940 [Spirochaetia bacterium]
MIITDGAASTQKITEVISAALAEHQVVVRPAESFTGEDLLPAHVFFLGCEKPNPPSFAYLAELLAHINLAGRPCGVFSANSKALKYLSGLVKDSEAVTGETLLAEDGAVKAAVVKKWLKDILLSGKGDV